MLSSSNLFPALSFIVYPLSISVLSEKSSNLVLRLKAIFDNKERDRVFRSDLDLLATEVPFSLHNLFVICELIPVADPSSYHFVDLMMRDYNHEDENDSPEMTFTHSMTVSTVPVNDDLVIFQSIQSAEAFVVNSAQKAHIIDKAYCVGHFASLKDCPDNFLALDANLHNQFDGRSVTPTGVPLFVIIPEEITSATISTSISSKVFTNVKVGIHFYNETAAATILASHFKSFETGPHQSVHMFLAAVQPELFVQCLNWKGLLSLSPFVLTPLCISFSARRTLEIWGQESRGIPSRFGHSL